MLNHPLSDRCCPICGNGKIRYWGSVPDIGLPEVRHDLSKCPSCTHVFVNPLPSADFLRVAYKTCNPSVFSSNGFVEARSSGPFTIADELVWGYASKSAPKGKFLDIGSANLNLLRKIKENGWELTLVEPSQHAGQFEEKLGCTVYDRPFEDCAFDCKFGMVSVIDVLEHVHSPVDFLRGVREILSEDGIALFRFPNSYSVRCRVKHDAWEMLRPLGHLHYFSPRSFEVACGVSGLKVKTVQSHDLNGYLGLHRHMDRMLKKSRFARYVKSRLDQALLGDQLFAVVT